MLVFVFEQRKSQIELSATVEIVSFLVEFAVEKLL